MCSGTYSLKVQPKTDSGEGFLISECKTGFMQFSVHINLPFTYLFPVSRLSVHSLLRFPLCATEIANTTALGIIFLVRKPRTQGYYILNISFQKVPFFPPFFLALLHQTLF